MGVPSEEVRELLDKRGIKYDVLHQDGLETVTYFDLPDGREVGYTEFSSGNTQLRIWNETPEQAITATVGTGTCHMEVRDNLAETEGMGDVWLECDKCHWQMPLEPSTPRFKYCPNCRRRIVNEESA